MPPAPQQSDPRREQLRQQAIQRRKAVADRISATRSVVIGTVIAISCVLAGYLDASAHTPTSSNSTNGAYANGAYANSFGSADNGNGAPNQGVFGGGSPPSASSGGGTAVSGGS
jgi:hypothetical protein